MKDYQEKFLNLAIESGAFKLGDFTLKSGRQSPYFFNAASFIEYGHLDQLAQVMAEKIKDSDISFDVIFGPAYKGIFLGSVLATKLNKPVCFNRKEEKDHGEGGALVGSVKNKKVLIIDDVLTAGTALKNSIKLIEDAGGDISAAIIALDRQEQDEGEQVSKKLANQLNIPIFSISSLENLVVYLETVGLKDTAEKLKTSLKN